MQTVETGEVVETVEVGEAEETVSTVSTIFPVIANRVSDEAIHLPSPLERGWG